MGVKAGMVNSRKLTRIACSSAILFVSQIILRSIPNVELVSLLIIIMTLTFEREMYLTTIVFALMEVLVYGFGVWVVMYFYIWNVLVFLVLRLKKSFKEDVVLWSVLSGIYGVCFGALSALIYLPINRSYMIVYWIAGLKFDLIHGIGNYTMAVLLFRPLLRIFKMIVREEAISK